MSSIVRRTSSTGVIPSHMCSQKRSTRSVPRRRRLPSSDRIRFLRWFPPTSAKRSKILGLSSFDAPPQSSPNVMVPRASWDILSPLCPSSW